MMKIKFCQHKPFCVMANVKTILEHVNNKVENDSSKGKEMCFRMMQRSTKKSMMEVMEDKRYDGGWQGSRPEKHQDHH